MAENTETENSEKSLDELVALAREQHVAMLATHEDGRIATRPMGIAQVDDELHLWFFCSAGSDVERDVAADARVNVALSDGNYLSIAGTGEVVQDAARAREQWGPFVEAWLQCEPEDEKVRLLHVTPESVAWWETPSSARFLVEVARAKVTGAQPSGGDAGAREL